jgi:hypothetical protein
MNYLNPQRGDLRIAALLFLGVSLGGCFASPDFSRITCKNDNQCAPGYQCNLTTNKCVHATDASSLGEVGVSHADGAFDVGASVDLAVSVDGGFADQASRDAIAALDSLPGADTGALADSQISYDIAPLLPDAPAGLDTAGPDVASPAPDLGNDLPNDVPSDLFVGSKDVPIAAEAGTDTALVADTRPAGLPLGATCATSASCALGNCVDGVCCDSPCTGACQSCALSTTPGTCSNVTGAPAPGHTPCVGSGTCVGTCNGQSASCAYHGAETNCGAASCTSGTATAARSCNGVGSCGAVTTTPCGNYVCGSTACLTTCSTVGDCVAGSVCTGGSCVACGLGETVCGTACVKTDSDNLNCGRCSHSCGGSATCSNGRCQPVAMVSSLPSSAGYDVGPDGLFYTSGGTVYGCTQTSCSGVNQRQIGGGFASTSDLVLTRGMTPNQVVFYASPSQPNNWLYACPVSTGCPSSPTQIIGYGATSQTSLASFQTYNGDVYYQNAGGVNNAIYHCSGTSSPCTLTAGGGPGTAHVPSASNSLDVARAFATDATYVYFLESIDSFNDFALDRCPNNGSCTTPNILVASIFSAAILVTYNGKLYWSVSTSGGPIVQCDLPGCTTQTNFLTTAVGAVLGMAVDSSGLYWMTTGGLYTCPLTGCPGIGPTAITGSVADGSKELRVQDSSVYWLTPGTGIDGAIYRVAKP